MIYSGDITANHINHANKITECGLSSPPKLNADRNVRTPLAAADEVIDGGDELGDVAEMAVDGSVAQVGDFV